MPVKPILIVVDNLPITDPSEITAFSTSLDFLRDTYHVLIIHRSSGAPPAANFFKVMDNSALQEDDETDLNTILGI